MYKKTTKIIPVYFGRERNELISWYATAAISLYGIISIDEFVDVFNNYEEAHTTADEVLRRLGGIAQTEEVVYSISGEILSGPAFQPQFDDYDENFESIRGNQRGKPHYLPDKNEFLRYINFIYREPEKPYADLKAFILKNRLTTYGDGIDGVDGDLLDLHEMIRFGVESTEELKYFTERGYSFKDSETLKIFSDLVMNIHNNTRMYDNNGFTPIELVKKMKPYTSK